MAVDPELGFDTDENGWGQRDDDGILLFHLGAGNGAPSYDAPVGSRYFQLDAPSTTDWRKTATGTGGWTNLSSAGSVIGGLWDLTFGVDGDDEWAGHTIKDKNSDDTPGIVIYDSNLIGMTFTNSQRRPDVDIEVYRVPFDDGRGPNPAEKIYTMLVRNERIKIKNDLSIPVNVGDKLAIFVRNEDDSPSEATIKLYFQITAATVLDNGEEWNNGIREE